jgi:hypothetical protein
MKFFDGAKASESSEMRFSEQNMIQMPFIRFLSCSPYRVLLGSGKHDNYFWDSKRSAL